MSCNSCGSSDAVNCGCNPCTQVQSQESIASALQNLTTALLGTFTKTVTNGRAVWGAQCTPNDTGLACFPKNSDEGFICYILRILDQIGLFSAGTHNPLLEYCKNTMVATSDSLYVAIQDVPVGIDILNTLYWELLISAPPGAQGPQGPAGAPGAGNAPNYAILVTVANVTLTDNDGVCICDNAGAIQVDLPTIAATLSGKFFKIKRGITSGGNVTIMPNGGDTIDGAASFVLSVAGEAVELVSDNLGDWRIL